MLATFIHIIHLDILLGFIHIIQLALMRSETASNQTRALRHILCRNFIIAYGRSVLISTSVDVGLHRSDRNAILHWATSVGLANTVLQTYFSYRNTHPHCPTPSIRSYYIYGQPIGICSFECLIPCRCFRSDFILPEHGNRMRRNQVGRAPPAPSPRPSLFPFI